MSKTKIFLMLGIAGLSTSSLAITNAELARLNNELIGLDARLAVAKKQAELAKYADTLSSPRPLSTPEGDQTSGKSVEGEKSTAITGRGTYKSPSSPPARPTR